MHVCRLWRATALKTPQLWAEAVAAPSTQLTFNKARIEVQCQHLEDSRISFAATAIELSSPAPLRLKIHFLPDALSQTLSSHTSRLVDLFVRLQSAAQLNSLCAFLANGVPNLNVLGIAFPGYSGMYQEWLAPDDDIDEGNDQQRLSEELVSWSSGVQGLIADTPRLQTLRCVPIDLVSHFACPTVRDMCITPAVFNPRHLEGFVHALKNTPDLTRLDLCMVNVGSTLRPEDDAPGWTASPVDLPALRMLVVNLNGNLKTAEYLDLIALPSSVGINIMQSDLGLSDLFHDFPSRRTPFIPYRLQSANAVHICDSYDRWKTPTVVVSTSKDDEELVRFTLTSQSHGMPYLPPFELIGTFRGTGAPVTHLVLHQNWAIEPTNGRPDIFRAFPHLTSLDLAGPRVHHVIEALQHPDVAFALNCGPGGSVSQEAWTALQERPVGWRETRGLRLARLDWEDREWDTTLGLEFPPSAVVGTYVPSPELFDQEELEKLVDGPVVFGGFTYQETDE
ncbi:uncharacterized protein BXZ73DRAFT_106255 [Epithele typhae]|uniref:uncharacterized protein n=1 Tax=Epithele typhae TaxID=378194 RepID=UPI0020073621|nr:uncharacterized protein BXZ73DRAFT_106255 [Epithele typhae]KAH9915283.1 hypothetical protein BXZ73DRAFT_106255 [Epithele typhae]